MSKKLFIKTYGCQMNVYDSSRMTDMLEAEGYTETDHAENADLIILNTCHIREKAEEKVYSELGRLRTLSEEGAVIAVGGCVGQAAGEEILRRAPYVDMVFGPQTYHRLPAMLREAQQKKGGVVDLEYPLVPKFDLLPQVKGVKHGSAFLSVQEGCDKFCTFCVVPYTRGAEFSRPVDDILAEARRLVEIGALEITLLGQNVNAYHGTGSNGKDWSLAKLIGALAKIEGLERIRYTTSHPRDMDDDLIAIHGDEPKLMPYLHLPVQSGSDRVLKAMNRKHGAEMYVDIVHRLRAARPDIALSSDFIVGFPGETEADFHDTMRLVETVGFAQAYSFKYSPRPGTPAADKDQVPESDKNTRLALLQGLLNRQQQAFNAAVTDSVMPVLFERAGRHAGQWIGKSPYLQSVHVQLSEGACLEGQLLDVRITDAYANSLAGMLVEKCGTGQPLRIPSPNVMTG